jgi:hypothetical protein
MLFDLNIQYLYSMDEGTIKKRVIKCRLYWRFCLGWRSNFVGSESGQKQSDKLLHNMVYNKTQDSHPLPPPTATQCLYIQRLNPKSLTGG